MSRLIVLAVSGFLASAVMVTPSFADEGTDHFCHTDSGAKSNNIEECCYNPDRDGPTNDEAHPFCPGYLPDGSNYPTLDRTQTLHGSTCAAGVNCGPPADLTNVKTFYDTAASAPVAPSAPVPASQPVAAAVPAAAVAAPVILAAPAAAIPAFAAVPVAGAVGLGGAAAAVAAGVVVAAGVGAVAIASSDDDDDNATSTTGTK